MARGLVTVTGATGFLGRYLVRALAADGWRIRVLARRDVVHPLWRELEVDVADRKSTRLNSSHVVISYAVFCLKKKISCPCI